MDICSIWQIGQLGSPALQQLDEKSGNVHVWKQYKVRLRLAVKGVWVANLAPNLAGAPNLAAIASLLASDFWSLILAPMANLEFDSVVHILHVARTSIWQCQHLASISILPTPAFCTPASGMSAFRRSAFGMSAFRNISTWDDVSISDVCISDNVSISNNVSILDDVSIWGISILRNVSISEVSIWQPVSAFQTSAFRKFSVSQDVSILHHVSISDQHLGHDQHFALSAFRISILEESASGSQRQHFAQCQHFAGPHSALRHFAGVSIWHDAGISQCQHFVKCQHFAIPAFRNVSISQPASAFGISILRSVSIWHNTSILECQHFAI